MNLPSDKELLQLQQSLQDDADWVLQKINLLQTLSQYGDVNVVGAKALGLLIARDIDISVVVPTVQLENWAELVKNLMITPHIRRVTAIDYYHYDKHHRYNPDEGEKYSLYVSMEKLLGQEQDETNSWECQIHLIKANKFDADFLNDMKEKLTEEKRVIILQLKYWANEVNKVLKEESKGNFKIPSMAIYTAVLEKGIKTIPEFVEYFIEKVPREWRDFVTV